MLMRAIMERMVERMRVFSGGRARTARSAAVLALPMLLALTACAARVPVVTRDDASITSDVQARLAADAQTKPFAITVDTKAGVVHVAGDVAKAADRKAVERIARDAPGVHAVDNNVRFGGVPVPVEPSAN
jgi:hypothetical protein